VAFSEYKPVADNATKEGRAKNRRIEITLVTKD
jgi:flagellar motor protein MotB